MTDFRIIPQIGPRPDGGVMIVWDTPDCRLELEFLPDGTAEWFFSDRNTEHYCGEDGLSLFDIAWLTRFGRWYQKVYASPAPSPAEQEYETIAEAADKLLDAWRKLMNHLMDYIW